MNKVDDRKNRIKNIESVVKLPVSQISDTSLDLSSVNPSDLVSAITLRLVFYDQKNYE